MSLGKAFENAERFTMENEDGVEETWVLLALTERGGKEYALLADEAELEGDDEDMSVAIFAFERDDEGSAQFSDIEDENLYDSLYEEFAEAMGLEESDEDGEST